MRGLFFFLLTLSCTLAGFSQENVPLDSLQYNLKKAYGFFDQVKLKKSVQTSMHLLDLAHKAENDLYIAEAYYLLALNDETARNYPAAEIKYKKALTRVEKLQDSTFMVLLYNGLGNVAAINEENFKQSEIYYQKGLRISEAINDPYQIALIANLCWNYLDDEKPEKVKPYLTDFREFLASPGEDFNRFHFIANINHILGRYYSQLGKYATSDTYFQAAIDISKKRKMWTELKNAYEYRSTSYERQGDHEKALEDLRKYIEYKEKYLNENTLEVLKKEEARLELKEHERELATAKRERQLIGAVSESKNRLLWVVGIAFLFVLVFLIIIYRENQSKKTLIKKLNAKNEELKRTKKQAEIAAETKKQFIANVSHEIRTPLHGVVGITSLLLSQPEISKDNKKLLTSLKFSGDYLLSLINNVLLMSKIDNNKIKVRPKVITIETLTTNILYAVQFQAEKNKTNVVFDVAHDVPAQIITDDSILYEILINLIENGIKFCNKGQVTVTISCLKKEANKLQLRFAISDTGKGIPADKKELIFEKFSQIATDKTSIMEGTGIGLSIVKSLLLLMNSDIQLDSEPGKGATFYFDLECENVENPGQHDANATVVNHDYKGKTILLVEDNDINKMVLTKYLSAYEFTIDVIADGKQGLRAIEQKTYDLILMDINVPSMNGFEITKAARKMQVKTPIVAVTASELSEVEEHVKSAGMNDVLIKPFSKEKLMQLIQKYIQ